MKRIGRRGRKKGEVGSGVSGGERVARASTSTWDQICPSKGIPRCGMRRGAGEDEDEGESEGESVSVSVAWLTYRSNS